MREAAEALPVSGETELQVEIFKIVEIGKNCEVWLKFDAFECSISI